MGGKGGEKEREPIKICAALMSFNLYYKLKINLILLKAVMELLISFLSELPSLFSEFSDIVISNF